MEHRQWFFLGFGFWDLRKGCRRSRGSRLLAASPPAAKYKKNPAMNAVRNSSFELVLKQVGPASAAFDFQLRPVGGHGLKGPVVFELTVQGLCFDTRA